MNIARNNEVKRQTAHAEHEGFEELVFSGLFFIVGLPDPMCDQWPSSKQFAFVAGLAFLDFVTREQSDGWCGMESCDSLSGVCSDKDACAFPCSHVCTETHTCTETQDETINSFCFPGTFTSNARLSLTFSHRSTLCRHCRVIVTLRRFFMML